MTVATRRTGFKCLSEFDKLEKGKVYTVEGKGLFAARIGDKTPPTASRSSAPTPTRRASTSSPTHFAKISIAYFKTHYYGGIKKYQWVSPARPDRRRLSKTVPSRNRTRYQTGGPVFYITDLLPHPTRTDGPQGREVIRAKS